MKFFTRIPHLMVFGLWSFFLFYLMLHFRYIRFLRPEFGILLILAHFICLAFFLTSLIPQGFLQHGHHHEHDGTSHPKIFTDTLCRVLILSLPIIFALAIPNGRLGNADFHNRYTGKSRMNVASSLAFPRISPQQQEEAEKKNHFPQLPIRTSLLEIFLAPQKYHGKTVELTAMFLQDKQMRPYFGMDTAVYRFLITCCAADAVPLAIALDLDQVPDQNTKNSPEWKNDQWIKVTAVFEIRTVNGKPMPFLSRPIIVPVDAPKVPWLL